MNPSPNKSKALALAALGVVYGDIGTSPLYALKEVLHTSGLELNTTNIYACLSLIFWSLIISVTSKYVFTMLNANNKGEGGIMALLSLALRKNQSARFKSVLILLGVTGAAFFYGDCVITPAISVLSAVEGVELITPIFKSYTIPISMIILFVLFWIQKRGTHKVGTYFGPIMLLWFVSLALLGLNQIVAHPQILQSLSPHYALQLIFSHPVLAFFVMGSVILVLTGGEALYSDMGHFGPKPIKMAWIRLVLPCLMLNYLGQGALILNNPSAIENPFYLLAPTFLVIPLVILALLATIIASQAVISGAYSLTQQAIQLGYLPRLKILHTSSEEKGQIYIPFINWVLAGFVLIAIVEFGSSSALAGAYGVAVTGNMIITSLLGAFVAFKLWKWPVYKIGFWFGAFLIADIIFFSSTLPKVIQGGWFPILFAFSLLALMISWLQGRTAILQNQIYQSMPLDVFINSIEIKNIHRVPGTALFLCSDFNYIPHSLIHNLYHNKILHEKILLIKISIQDTPYVDLDEQIEAEFVSDGIWKIKICYGYMDNTQLIETLLRLQNHAFQFRVMESSFFMTKQTIMSSKKGNLIVKIRDYLFSMMMRNSPSPTSFFNIPSNRVLEVGSQVIL